MMVTLRNKSSHKSLKRLEMILVTGATGHFGGAAIRSLIEKGVEASQLVALVRNAASADGFRQQGIGVVEGDYSNYASLVAAFKGVEKVLFVSGSDVMNRMAQHENVVKAAAESGVKHVVYTSFQRKNETETSPIWMVAQSHIQTEKWLKASGMGYTFLRNNLYMDFLPGFIGDAVLETGVVFVPAGNGKVSAVLRSEMAEAAATILTTSGHEGKEYGISNTEAASYHDIVQWISEASGKSIQYVSPSVDDYSSTLAKFGLPAEVVGIFSSFAVAQAQGELDAESGDLEALLGRRPQSVKDFVSNLYAARA